MRGQLRWNGSGIIERAGTDAASLLAFLAATRRFSSAVAEFLRAVGGVDLLRGQLATGATTATAALQFFPHGLGRPYQGVLVCAQDIRGVALSAALPSDVRAASRDPALVFGLEPASATAVAFSAWVF